MFINPDEDYHDGRFISATKYVQMQSLTHQPSCYITAGEVASYSLEVHCRAETSSRNATISCFQNNNVLPMFECENDVKGVFLVNCSGGVYCCSHELYVVIDQGSCHDFIWVPVTDEGNCQSYFNKEYGDERNAAAKMHFSCITYLTYICFISAVLILKTILW